MSSPRDIHSHYHYVQYKISVYNYCAFRAAVAVAQPPLHSQNRLRHSECELLEGAGFEFDWDDPRRPRPGPGGAPRHPASARVRLVQRDRLDDAPHLLAPPRSEPLPLTVDRLDPRPRDRLGARLAHGQFGAESFRSRSGRAPGTDRCSRATDRARLPSSPLRAARARWRSRSAIRRRRCSAPRRAACGPRTAASR